MNAERWQEVERLFHAAVELREKDQAAWLVEACAGDEDLRREVQSLLQYQAQAERFIESPALELAANMYTSGRIAAAAPGQTINQYRITSVLGAGGMGEVYLAEDTRLQRRVALKLLAVDFDRDRVHLRRFEQEARAIAALSHPNVCVIHEVIETVEGRQCIVMEYVDGVNLREHLAARQMKVSEALDVAIQVASALAAAHGGGIVHRDIKPENIMLRGDGYVKVLDFGLAQLSEQGVDDQQVSSQAGAIMGTLRYLSPEQARGLSVDPRTDLWSLGVVLYEMVAGQQPFVGPTPADVLNAIAEREPSPLATSTSEVPARFDEIVKKALEKNRQERYPSANDLLADLRELSQDLELAIARDRQGSGRETSSAAVPAADHVLVHAEREVPLREGENIVGRDPAASVRFASGSVSRQHAAILVEGEQATVVDLQSKNGTFVDGEPVTGPQVLRDGMTLRFGTLEMVYRWAPAHQATESIAGEH